MKVHGNLSLVTPNLPKINFFFNLHDNIQEAADQLKVFQPFAGGRGGRGGDASAISVNLSAGLIIRIQIPIRQNHVQLMISENETISSPFDLHTNSWLKSLQAVFVSADDFLTSVSIRKRKVQKVLMKDLLLAIVNCDCE